MRAFQKKIVKGEETNDWNVIVSMFDASQRLLLLLFEIRWRTGAGTNSKFNWSYLRFRDDDVQLCVCVFVVV